MKMASKMVIQVTSCKEHCVFLLSLWWGLP